jgi:hypothetical protein
VNGLAIRAPAELAKVLADPKAKGRWWYTWALIIRFDAGHFDRRKDASRLAMEPRPGCCQTHECGQHQQLGFHHSSSVRRISVW